MQLEFSLHPHQLTIFNSEARFKVVLAGRRFGKSYLAAVTLLIEGMREENGAGYGLQSKDVYYVAPTQQQARDILWVMVRNMGQGLIESTHENTMLVRLVNGRRIHLKGSDRPDTLRGVGLSYVVLDEYADMKPETFEQILRPALADVEGGALFIGTPKPIGLCPLSALIASTRDDPEWESWRFRSIDNPFLVAKEIESARRSMSSAAFMQEFEALPQRVGDSIFNEDDIIVIDHTPPEIWAYVMPVDLAGFSDNNSYKKLSTKFRRLDESVVACVGIDNEGWYVDDMIGGRWGVRETALKILRAAQKYRPAALGIERGALKNAVLPYMQDYMRRLHIYPRVIDLTHGGKHKTDRITWALQGRLQNKRIRFRDRPYLKTLREQLISFPNPMMHDDYVDALSYADQLGDVGYSGVVEQDTWQALDAVAGY